MTYADEVLEEELREAERSRFRVARNIKFYTDEWIKYQKRIIELQEAIGGQKK